jgi:hypothetical protein
MKFKFKSIIYFSVFSILLIGCKKDKTEKKQLKPKADKVFKSKKLIDFARVSSPGDEMPSKHFIDSKPLMPAENPTCTNVCNQLGYCSQTKTKRKFTRADLRMCIKLCKYDKTETGKEKSSAIINCASKYRGDKCAKLKECISSKYLEIRKRLLGKEIKKSGVK